MRPVCAASGISTGLRLPELPADLAGACLASGPAAAKAGRRGQTLLSLPTMAITFGAAISLLWAHAIYDTLKVRMPQHGQCMGCRAPTVWRMIVESLWRPHVLATGCQV